ncbi:MAG: PAS domain-containing sensor histidine kinase [Bacteroidota bacterium]|nr:PAS domain-containing sensor histidine kinase [Bacteroidota bacterium]
MDTKISKTQQQLQYIEDFLIKIGNGDYNSKLPITDENDEQLLAVQVGINMLVEELNETTISRVFLNSIYNGINDVLIVLNENGEIQNTNHVVEDLLFYSQAELLNQSFEKLFPISDIDNVRNSIRTTFEQNKIQEIGLNLKAKDNSIIPVSCSFSPLHNNKQEYSGTLLVAKNITALLNAKNQLQEKNDELNLFVYKASHDLKSPVASMMALMALHNESENAQEKAIYIEKIGDCTSKLNIILSDLLVLGRITYGELEFEQTSIKEVIDSILKSIEFVEGFKDIDLNIVIDDQAQFINTEKGLFQTILLNLIDNAVKYRQKGLERSLVNIHVSSQGKGILFKIEDNGIGIPETLQASIFKMFYRATSTSKGTGLGLYIVKTSVIKLGGTISFESTLGKGSTFKIHLPFK